jgi:hypothetical protein
MLCFHPRPLCSFRAYITRPYTILRNECRRYALSQTWDWTIKMGAMHPREGWREIITQGHSSSRILPNKKGRESIFPTLFHLASEDTFTRLPENIHYCEVDVQHYLRLNLWHAPDRRRWHVRCGSFSAPWCVRSPRQQRAVMNLLLARDMTSLSRLDFISRKRTPRMYRRTRASLDPLYLQNRMRTVNASAS